MNLIVANSKFEQKNLSSSPSLMENTASPTAIDWHDFRVAEMSGFDYIFAPENICQAFTDLKTLKDFIESIQELLYSEPERVVLVGYSKNVCGEYHFERFDINWVGDQPLSCEKQALVGTAQLEFIAMLFEHSQQLYID